MGKYFVLLGPPGAGKGTQAKLVANHFGVPHVSTGDLFRALKIQDTPFARKVQEVMANGALVGDDDTIQMVRDRLSQPDAKNGAVLDGFPRNLYQADAFEIMLRDELRSNVTAALHFDASKDVVMERILNRGRAEGRADDTVETARVRYEVYLESTAPLIGYYHAKGLRHIIDATPNIEDVSATLMTLLKSL